MSKRVSKNDILKIYRDFFNQAKYVLSKKGRILVLTLNQEVIIEKAKEYKFRISTFIYA